MSQPSSLLVVSNGDPSFAQPASEQNGCAVIGATWDGAVSSFEANQPAAVIAVMSEGCDDTFMSLAASAAGLAPYVPMIRLGDSDATPENVLPCRFSDNPRILSQRLNAALRVRTLHATLLRRADPQSQAAISAVPNADFLRETTALLLGRGPSYPGLSVAIGQRMDVIGALSVEAAARHLNMRDIDGVFIGEGFGPRVIDAFLTVLSEDVRFRNLPVIITGRLAAASPVHELANLEVITGEPRAAVSRAVPLIRQHAFELRLKRELEAIDSNGLLDARTGLLTVDAFERDFAQTFSDTQDRGGHLSAARFSFDTTRTRSLIEAARMVSRLMRKMDFAALQDDGSIIAAFADTDLRAAHVITRRLASILQSTLLGGDGQPQLHPRVTLATLKANDTAAAMRERLTMSGQQSQTDLRTRLASR